MPKKQSTKTTTKKTTGTSKTGKAVQAIERNEFFTEVQQKAFEKFLERQMANEPGNELSDWLLAEKEISKKYKSV